ncbi:MAG TPA: hypothetical protein VEQ65_05005, partial [Opitutus sp.]|nr:hypothetical protein [Opitutus sp.]
MIISNPDLNALLSASHTSPHSVLGMHPTAKGNVKGVVVRALLRNAATCSLIDVSSGQEWSMESIA